MVHAVPDRDRREAFTVNGTLTIAPTTELFADLVFQLNEIQDRAVIFARLRWTYATASDLFFVYREDLEFQTALEASRSFTLQLTYRFDTVL